MPEVPAATSTRAGPATIPAGWAYTAFVAACVVVALYVARDILVPIALAILLSFVLAPIVRVLRRLHIARTPAVIASVLLAFLLFLSVSTLLTMQLTQLADNLPRYQTNLHEKVQAFRLATSGSHTIERVTEMLQGLRREISRPMGDPGGAPAVPPPAGEVPAEPRPMPVEIRQPAPEPMAVIQEVLSPVIGPLTTTGLVIVFAIFILLYREDLRDRFIRLFGTYDLHRTTEAMNETASRLSRYFLVQTGLNSAFGIFIGFGLWLIGVPNPILWGILAALMRFVPYIGSIIAAVFPAMLALAVDPGWSLVLWTVGLFLISEPVMGQVVEPWAFGHSTGLSPFAVIVAATFWLWLWGPIGLLLATPLTLCVMVLGRHVERMQFFEILLGDQPALTPDKSFYQRMLAGDPYEVAEQAERYLREHPLSAYYDEVALPGLILADRDAREGRLDDARLEMIRDSVATVVEDLSEYDDEAEEGGEAPGALEPEEVDRVPASLTPEEVGLAAPSVLCVPVHSPLEQAAAQILAQLIEKHGLDASAVALKDVTRTGLQALDPGDSRIVCVSFFGSDAGLARARYLIRRLKRKIPRARFVACLWDADPARFGPADVSGAGAEAIASGMREAVDACVQLARADAAAVAKGDVLPAATRVTAA